MKIKKWEFLNVIVDSDFHPSIAIKLVDERNEGYLLIKKWEETNDNEDSDDYFLIMKSIDKETRREIEDYINEMINNAMKALENTL